MTYYSRYTKREKCVGSKQKCEKPVNTFHNLSVVLATVIPVVCVIVLVSCIIFYLWRRHRKEEEIGQEFDNKIEEDLDELYYMEDEGSKDAIIATGNDEEGTTADGSRSSDAGTSTTAVARRNNVTNRNGGERKSRMSFFSSSKTSPSDNNTQVRYKEKGRLAIMRQRMKELETQSRIATVSNNNSNISLAALRANNVNSSVDDLSLTQPPGLIRVHSNNTLSSANSKKSNLALTNDSLNIPMLPSNGSVKPALTAHNSSNSISDKNKNSSNINQDHDKSAKSSEKVDSILLNSNRLEDVSEQDMREYMRHYDKIMGISGLENMSGSFPGGRVPSGILQQGKFFSKNPYNRNNNTSSALKGYFNHPKNISSPSLNKDDAILNNLPKEVEKAAIKDRKSSIISDDKSEVFGTPTESAHFSKEFSAVHSNKSNGTLKRNPSIKGNTEFIQAETETSADKDVFVNKPSVDMSQNLSKMSIEEPVLDNNPFLSTAEKIESKETMAKSLSKNSSNSNNRLNNYLQNDLNKNLIANLKNNNNSGLLHQVEVFDATQVSDAIKDIDIIKDKDDIILSPEQEESLRRLKSVYNIYMDKKGDKENDEDAQLEDGEKDDQFGDLTHISSSSAKVKKHTSSIYSDFNLSKGYSIPSQEQHALPNYDMQQYANRASQPVENTLPNPELFADYYELDPESEQYYYYDAPSEIHYYFDPISQQYYYYLPKEEQYYCNIDGHTYLYDSINHIPYYYDEEQAGYFYLGQPELDNTQFQQHQLVQPNSYRNTQLEQHIVETEEDHPEMIENMKTLMNPSSMDEATNYSLTNFNRSKNRKITPHKQFQHQMSQALAFDPLDNRETSYSNLNLYNSPSHQYKTNTIDSKKSPAYKLSRESVVMTDPLQFSGAKTKFRPAGSIRNLSSYLNNNNHGHL